MEMSIGKAPSLDTTLEVRDLCLCLHLQRAARAAARRFDRAFRPLGLTNGQFSLLMALNRPEPAMIGPLAALLAMDRTTLTAALKPLVRRGLVEIGIDAADRRRRRLRLARGRSDAARRGAAGVAARACGDRGARSTATLIACVVNCALSPDCGDCVSPAGARVLVLRLAFLWGALRGRRR